MTILFGRRPKNMKAINGLLQPCPDSPNCVSSQMPGTSHFVEPLTFRDTPAASFLRLKKVILEMRGTTIVQELNHYLHVECRSALLGFIDDLVLMLDGPAALWHVRSASRVGYSDLGANRRRVEMLRQKFNRKT